MNDLILYTTDDGRSQVQLRAKDQTVWLTQRDMAQLFDVSTDHVGLHLKNIFADEELEASSVAEEEIDTLNRLVVIFLETGELRAKGKQETRMAFWKQNVDQIITSNGFLRELGLKPLP